MLISWILKWIVKILLIRIKTVFHALIIGWRIALFIIGLLIILRVIVFYHRLFNLICLAWISYETLIFRLVLNILINFMIRLKTLWSINSFIESLGHSWVKFIIFYHTKRSFNLITCIYISSFINFIICMSFR